MTNKLYQIINQYKETQSNYREKYKEKLRLRAKISKMFIYITNDLVRPNLSDQEVDHLVESGTIEYAQEIVGGHRHKLAVDSLGYIEQRHKDIVSIESGIKDLHQLFVDMSFLVQEQELMLDNIETNVQNSNLMVENAKKNLTNANKGAKKSRKVKLDNFLTDDSETLHCNPNLSYHHRCSWHFIFSYLKINFFYLLVFIFLAISLCLIKP